MLGYMVAWLRHVVTLFQPMHHAKKSIGLRMTRTAILIGLVSANLGWVSTEPVDEVNIFLGTDWDRRLDLTTSAQCTPAAIRPFGMISPGPFNEQYTNSGYSHAKKSLIGFNHTHLSGVGVGSYGLMDAFGVRTSQRMTSAQ
jgi:putative alpha-1,2-mannosidase